MATPPADSRAAHSTSARVEIATIDRAPWLLALVAFVCAGCFGAIPTTGDAGCVEPCPASPHASASCVMGRCVSTCEAGFGDCDGNLASNGCETPLVSNAANCGACGTRCVAACVNGQCREVTAISSGYTHACALMTDRTLECWGADYRGQLGDGVSVATPGPQPRSVAGLSSVSQVSSGGAHTCATFTNGTAACWGENIFGQLGNGVAELERRTAGPVVRVIGEALTGVSAISAGTHHTCLRVSQDGKVWCWGRNDSGQVGGGPVMACPAGCDGGCVPACTMVGAYCSICSVKLPTSVMPLSDVAEVFMGDFHTCALSRGQVQCWGFNGSGQLGVPANQNLTAPGEPVSGLSDAVAISGGTDFTCALRATGDVVCWGSDLRGQLGDGMIRAGGPTPVPVVLPPSGPPISARQISAGWNFACALLNDGSVWCWGDDRYGQLGEAVRGFVDANGVFNPGPPQLPRQVVGVANLVQQISSGNAFTCALIRGGTVQCWGVNDFGQLGDATAPAGGRAAPMPVVW